MPRSLLIIVSIALIFRILIFGGIFATAGPDGFLLADSHGFVQVAENILAGNGFSQDAEAPFTPDSRFPPLYPLLIAVSLSISSSVIPLVLFQLLLSSIYPILVWHIASYISTKKSVRTTAAILSVIEPLSIFLSLVVLTDMFFVFLMLLGILFLLRFIVHGRENYLFATVSAFFFGLSALTRPETFYITQVVAGFLLTSSVFSIRTWKFTVHWKQLKASLIFFLIFFVTISPWITRNYAQFDTIAVASTGARNVYTSFAVSIQTFATGKPYHEVAEKMRQDFAETYGVEIQDLTTDPSLGNALMNEGLRIVFSNPRATIGTVGITLWSFFTQDLYVTYLNRYGFFQNIQFDFSPSVMLFTDGPIELGKRVWSSMGIASLIPIIARLFWIVLTLLCIYAVAVTLRFDDVRIKIATSVLAGFILIFAAGTLLAGFSDHGRHRYRVDPLIFILASVGFVEFYERRSKTNIFTQETLPV